MLAVSKGRLVSSRRRSESAGLWQQVRVTWHDCPRITAEFISEEERALGRSWVAQEYECNFEALEGFVYPDFAQCVVDICPHIGKPVGGHSAIAKEQCTFDPICRPGCQKT